jgi:hypothetical protein
VPTVVEPTVGDPGGAERGHPFAVSKPLDVDMTEQMSYG